MGNKIYEHEVRIEPHPTDPNSSYIGVRRRIIDTDDNIVLGWEVVGVPMRFTHGDSTLQVFQSDIPDGGVKMDGWRVVSPTDPPDDMIVISEDRDGDLHRLRRRGSNWQRYDRQAGRWVAMQRAPDKYMLTPKIGSI